MQEWFFAFKDGTTIFNPLLKKGFGHVFVFSIIGDRIFVVNPHRSFIELINISSYDKQFPDIKEVIEEIKKNGAVVVRAKIEPDIKERCLEVKNMFPSCVNLAKMVSCYRSWSQTPYQLYNSLLKNGAERI